MKCHLSIPQQQMFELPASECKIVGDSLFLEFSKGMQAKFRGKIGAAQIAGTWIQANLTFPLAMQKSDRTLYQLYAANALDIAEKNALNSKNVDWAKLRDSVSISAGKATSVDELLPALQTILRSLQDKHGFVYFDKKSTGYENNDPDRVSPALRKAAYGNDKEIVSVAINDSIAYLRIPTSPDFQSGEDEAYNQQIQKQVCDLLDKNTRHWIIDLRLNYGGSMFAMLGGLNKLIGDGTIGSFVNREGKEPHNWIMKGGDFYDQQEQRTSSGMRCKSQTKPGKIAVLTGPITASSGEAVAVAFRSLDNSRIFGEPTKGFTTGLSGFAVGKDLVFFIATTYYADAKGRVYKQGVVPDTQINGGDHFTEILKDEKVKAALGWIGR
ncbi:S41 family peptidase [Dyadobacter sp.]|uniref:S41 family peptidase n=1 Tax=Dyadobacter sp. TaxID=1914288 RepID=UPI003F730E6F